MLCTLLKDVFSPSADNSTADKLFNKVWVLCYIPCTNKSFESKARLIMNTWGKHCNKLILFTRTDHRGFPTVALGIPDTGSYNLTHKMFVSMKYLHDHHLNEFDWFIKADTDTYVIVENLRYMLSGHQPTELIYFGHHFKVGLGFFIT